MLNSIKISYHNLSSAKFRSFLTMLGIIIGVAAVIIVMSIGSSAQALILDQVKGVGSNLVVVLPGASSKKGPPATVFGVITTTLKYEDLKYLAEKKRMTDVIGVAGYVTGSAELRTKNYSSQTKYQGVTSNLVDVEKIEIKKGRFFTADEETNLSRVIVLGHNQAKNLFPNDNPIGKSVVLKNLNFSVIGIIEKRGSVAFGSPDDEGYVPLFTAQKVMLNIDYLNLIRAKVDRAENIKRAVSDIEIILRERHDIKNSKDDDFSVRDTAQALEMLTNITNVLKYFLVFIAAISLVVGGIGVMNIMLISVHQRIREVGLRIAVGAKKVNIISQFLVESIFITLAGGMLGIIAGVGISFIASIIIAQLGYSWNFIVSFQSIVLGALVTIVIGIIFGVYPALKASRVSPMEALRYE